MCRMCRLRTSLRVAGPLNIDCWCKSYACFRTALVTWKAVELERLDMHANMFKRYVSQYGSSVWFQIYQAESRCRSEHMERARRRGEEDRARVISAGLSHPLNPSLPWDSVWGEVLIDVHVWRVELEELALLILSRSVGRLPSSDIVAPIPSGKRWFHDDTGACVVNQQSSVCPQNGSLVHQCSRCLDTSHGAHACRRWSVGQVEGFGKAKSKQKGNWQSSSLLTTNVQWQALGSV